MNRNADAKGRFMAQKKYYAVAAGRNPGIYTQWFGENGAQVQVIGCRGAIYKGFPTRAEAKAFIDANASAKGQSSKRPSVAKPDSNDGSPENPEANQSDRIVIYTDGSSLGNPGPGGYGVVIPSSGEDLEFSDGYRRTTNNRMELLACIVGLEHLRAPSAVSLYSDSRYVVDGITKGWARRWQSNGWRKSNGSRALNADLWKRLLKLCQRHDVQFIWVKGHAGNPGNERCDRLATQAASQDNLPPDKGFEEGCS